MPVQDGYTAVLSRDILVRQSACYIAELRSLAALPEKHFSQLYLSPVANYLAFTQHCAKEIIEQHFQRIMSGLKRRRALLLPPGVPPEAISHQKDLWTYVAFTWLLLYRVADQINAYALVHKQPEELDSQARKWCPFHGALAPPRRFKVLGQLPVSLHASSALLPLILPPDGLAWLYSDSRAINTLLDSLVSPDKDSPLSTLLGKSAKAPATAESENVITPDTQPLGQRFRDWLLQALVQENSKIISHTSEGIALLCPDIFRQFLADCAGQCQLEDWQAVQMAFLDLKLHKVNTKTGKALQQSQWPGRGACQVIVLPASFGPA